MYLSVGSIRSIQNIFLVAMVLLAVTESLANDPLPAGLYSQDSELRLLAVQQVESRRLKEAEPKLVSMINTDPYAEVRAAACQALGVIGATNRIEFLRSVAVSDLSADVRAAAFEAVRMLEGSIGAVEEPKEPTVPPEQPEKPSDEKHKQPSLSLDENEPVTKYFAFGIGSMGGYGIAALTLRGRIPTGLPGLPWIGVEAGAGWTPPGGYALTAGPVDEINNEDYKWKIITGAGGVLFFLHRLHYIAVRGGFDIGRSGFGLVGYGFEHLNQEGFFSWGVEAGIVIQPGIDGSIDNLVVCDPGSECSTDDLWPVVPYVRFSLHFYLI